MELAIIFAFIFTYVIIALLIIAIHSTNEKMERISEMFFTNKTFIQKERKLAKEKDILKEERTTLKIQYSLLLYAKKNTNDMLLLRLILIRKIANLLISEIVNKHKESLRRTKKKYLDILKPEGNKNQFYIIYCYKEQLEGVTRNQVNIIFDWLMHIHDFTSSKIHLCRNRDLPELFELLAQNLENLEKEEIINYLMKPYEPKKFAEYKIKNVYDNIKGEDSQNSMKMDNIQEVKEEKDNNKNERKESKKIKKKKKKNKENKNKKEEKTEEIQDGKKEQNEMSNIINRNVEKNNNKNVDNIKFENFKEFICKNEKYTDEELGIIRTIYNENINKKFNLKDDLKSLADNNNEISQLNNLNKELKKIINEYDYGKNSEYTIEHIFEQYKLHFDKNSVIYLNKQNNINNHYRFKKSYKKIIEIDRVKNLTLEETKEQICKLVGNGNVNLLLQDKGKFGEDLEIEDVV